MINFKLLFAILLIGSFSLTSCFDKEDDPKPDENVVTPIDTASVLDITDMEGHWITIETRYDAFHETDSSKICETFEPLDNGLARITMNINVDTFYQVMSIFPCRSNDIQNRIFREINSNDSTFTTMFPTKEDSYVTYKILFLDSDNMVLRIIDSGIPLTQMAKDMEYTLLNVD